MRTAARPVPIDKRLVTQTAKDLWRTLWNSHLSYFDPDVPVGKRELIRPMAHITVPNVMGRTYRDVPIYPHFTRPEGWWHTKLTDGGWMSRTEHGDRPRIVVKINGTKTPTELNGPLKDRLIRDIASVLLHEVTHVADVTRGNIDPEEDYGGYINQPHEVRAFMQQIVDEALQEADRAAKDLEGFTDTAQLVELGLRHSSSWDRARRHLKPAARRKILQAVYAAIDEADLVAKYTPENDWDDDWKPPMPFPDPAPARVARRWLRAGTFVG